MGFLPYLMDRILIMIKHWASRIFIVAILIMAISGCDADRIYDVTYSIEEDGWNNDSVFHYEVEITDSIGLNNFFINIRNNTDYPYSNIYLFVSTVFPSGHTTRDTIECILADRNGMWLGSGSGKIKDNQIMLQQALRFPATGTYHFYLEQGMRKKHLKGIEDIGIRIEKHTP
jgi:gliding motility-associated lipoprotein GldH